MKKISFIIISFMIFINVFAQNPNDAIIVFNSGGATTSIDLKSKPPETKGSYYYNNEWFTGTIKLFSGEEIRNYPLKYDMRLNQINIKTDLNVKIVSIGAVKEIIWLTNKGQNEKLVNCVTFVNKNNIIGFYQILSEGKITFLKKTKLKLLSSNYNGTVVAGDKADKYIKEDDYFIYTGSTIIPIRKNKRKILQILKNNSKEIENFADQNKLSFKKESDLLKIFNYYNSL